MNCCVLCNVRIQPQPTHMEQVGFIWHISLMTVSEKKVEVNFQNLKSEKVKNVGRSPHLEFVEFNTIILKHMKQFQTWRWFITWAVSCGGQHKARSLEDYSDEIVKFIILTAGYSNFFAAEPCRFSRVQTHLSTSSESIKSDTS